MKALIVLNIITSLFTMWMVIELAKVMASFGDTMILMAKTISVACH